MNETSASKELVIADVLITQDDHGRYNLNALHQASEQVDNSSKKPGEWLKRKSTKELISELKTQVVNSPLEVVHGGDRQGTYAHEVLAVEYAGWISPAFRIKVNQAFIDSRKAVSLPRVHDPIIQAHINTLVEVDRVRTVAEDAKKEAAEAKDMAIQTLHAVSWLAVSQYVYLHGLHHQLPPPMANAYGRYLTDYCIHRNIPMGFWHPYGKKWEKENTYPVSIIERLLPQWLLHRNSQGNITGLQIEEDGVSYGVSE